MMKPLRKLLCMLLTVLMLVPFGTMAMAADSEVYISSIYLVEDGVGREISYSEFMALEEQSRKYRSMERENQNETNSESDKEDPGISPNTLTFDKYVNNDDVEYTWYDYQNPIGVSAVVEGPMTIGVSEMETRTISATFTTSASLSASLKKEIAASASFSGSLSVSAAVSKTQTVSEEVPAGMYGRICFRPRYNHMEGIIEHWVTYETGVTGVMSTDFVESEIPVVVSSFADGIYYLATAQVPAALPD